MNRWSRCFGAAVCAAIALGAAPVEAEDLPPGALARLGTLRLRHASKINAVAFSPDGKLLASASGEDGGGVSTVRVWDVATAAEQLRLVHRECGNCVTFSPDGKIIATSSNECAVVFWDSATGKEIRRSGQQPGIVQWVAYSPDGKLLASVSANSKVVQLWDVNTGNEVRQLTAEGTELKVVAFTPNGKEIIAGGGSWAKTTVWEVATGEKLRTFGGEHTPGAEGLAISPDGQILVTADGAVHVYNLGNGEHQRKLGGNRTDVGAERIAISPDGKKVALGGVGILRVWDVSSDKGVFNIPTHAGFSGGVAFSPDGKHFAWGGYGNTVRIWEAGSGKELHASGPQSEIFFVGFGPGGKSAFVDGGGTCIWDLTAGKEVFAPAGRRGERLPGIAGVIGMSPDGKIIVTGGYSVQPSFVEAVSGKPINNFVVAPAASAIRATFSPDGKHVVLLYDDMRTMSHWDLAKGAEVCRFVGHSSPVDAIAVSPDGKCLVSSGTPRAMMRRPPPGFKEDTAGRVWDMAAGKELRQFSSRDLSFAFSPDGSLLAAANDGWVRLIDPITGTMIRRLEGPKYGAYRVAFSPNGKSLASVGRDKQIWLWEVATGSERRTFVGHTGDVYSVAFSPNGRQLLSGGADTTALLWDVYSFAEPVGDLANAVRALDGTDAAAAYRAMCSLIAASDRAVPLLAAALNPAEPVGPRRLAKLTADLDSQQFAEREKATAELAKLADAAEPALRELLSGKPSPEARRRAEQVLEGLKTNTAPALLRGLRVVEVLEAIASPAARGELDRLAGGAAGVLLTREAHLALDRLIVREARHWSPPAQMSPADAEALLGGLVKGGVDADGKPLPPWAIARFGTLLEPDKGGARYVPSPDARLAVVYGYELPTMSILELPSGRERQAIKPPTRSNWFSEAAFSPDGTKLAADNSSGSERPTFLFVWDVASGKELWRSAGGVTGLGSLAWSPDNKMVATSGGEPRTLRVWDAATGKEIRSWSSPHHHTMINFSEDSKRLIAVWPKRRTLVIENGIEVADAGAGSNAGEAGTRRRPAPKFPQWSPTGPKGPCVFEPATGELRLQPNGHPPLHDIFYTAFSPDRKTAVSADNHGLMFVWDLTGLAPDGKFPAINLNETERAGLWRLLPGDDAAIAYRAGWRLTAGGDASVAFIKNHLAPVPQVSGPFVEELVANLGAADEAARQAATERLECLGPLTVPALRGALPGRPAGETRDRMIHLLERADRPIPGGGLLQAIRAIEVLERIATPGARVVLDDLAAGRVDADITRKAVQSCRRLTGGQR
jgi:WD40 repeat protein